MILASDADDLNLWMVARSTNFTVRGDCRQETVVRPEWIIEAQVLLQRAGKNRE